MANYDLWKLFDGMQPKASVPPVADLQLTEPYGRTGRKGRPYSQTAKEFGQFLKAIAEVNSANLKSFLMMALQEFYELALFITASASDSFGARLPLLSIGKFNF